MTKTPIVDGASGLHYSGQTYMNNVQLITQSICPDAAISYTDPNFSAQYPNGVSPSQPLPIDPTTNRISSSAIHDYVEGTLIPGGKVPDQMATIDAQIQADRSFYASVKSEYCFYETRYIAALTQFIKEVSSTNATATSGQAALTTTINLNVTLNTLLEIMNYVGNKRARAVNDRNNDIFIANQKINKRLGELTAQQAFLNSSNVRLKTQSEMMRYSKEKNNAMNIQIMFFVALNVVALGTVFIVYKNVKSA
jgi:hypothetical protein